MILPASFVRNLHFELHDFPCYISSPKTKKRNEKVAEAQRSEPMLMQFTDNDKEVNQGRNIILCF